MTQQNCLGHADWERERLHLLGCTRLLDSGASEAFDRITRLAARIFEVPIALVSLVDADRQWFKSRFGLDVAQTDRSSSFCSHAIERREVMVVEDATLDPRFAANPLVLGEPRIRFYAGAPLILESGHALGSLCVIDQAPRSFSDSQRQQLIDLAAMVMAQVDLHQKAGRINEVTRLPNRAQMVDDLDALTQARADGERAPRRALMLMEVVGHQQLQEAVRAMGIGRLEPILRDIASRLQSLVGRDATLYHLSETRFGFLLPPAGRDAANRRASRLVACMREPLSSGGIMVELDIQAGLVEFPIDVEGVGDALRKATAAMHESAAQGAPFLWHDAGADALHRRSFGLIRQVSPGLERGEFRLVYQPKLDLATNTFSGVEALARWTHPLYGEVSPGEFIPLVERAALIHEFTAWVLNAALAQLEIWRAQGCDLTVAVNVSSRNLEHPGFVRVVRDACALHGSDPRRLHVECTEHAVLTSAATRDSLAALRDMGVQISLDDFGMGYSNLSCLGSLPVEMLKLDQSLIKPMASGSRARELVKSLVSLGHAMGYRMLAEGVESQAIFEMVIDAGCDAVQGYHLSRPLEPAALLDFIIGRKAETSRERLKRVMRTANAPFGKPARILRVVA